LTSVTASRETRTSSGALAWAAVLLAVGPARAQPGAPAWLEGTHPAGWNRPGAGVPEAPPPAGDLPDVARCRNASARPPGDAVERLVAASGWTLFGAAQEAGGARMVSACTSVDGMCRPLGYQVFVFVDGRFAGTLSPRPMDARGDGSATAQRFLSPVSVVAEFSRYAPSDPLCCPSRFATVSYELRRTARGPVLVPTHVTTAASGRAGAPR